MNISKNTTNEQYIHGDFDHDGVPNIDDKYPFDKKRKERVNSEVSMSKLFKYVDNKRKEAEPIAKKLAKTHGFSKYRVKDTYSTINKVVRRNSFVSNDFIGLRSETHKRSSAKEKFNRFNKINSLPNVSKGLTVGGELVGSEDKYKTNKGSNNLYRAYHSNFVLESDGKKFGVEAQFRTKRYGKLNDLMHTDYKKGRSMKKYNKISKDLLKRGY